MMHDRLHAQTTTSAAWWEAVTSEFVYEREQVLQQQKQQQKLSSQPYALYDCQQQQQQQQLMHQSYHPILPPVPHFSPGPPDAPYVAQTTVTDTASLYATPTPPAIDAYGCSFPEQTFAPCEGPQPWNYAYCYGYYDEPACPMMNLVDMEDFM